MVVVDVEVFESEVVVEAFDGLQSVVVEPEDFEVLELLEADEFLDAQLAHVQFKGLFGHLSVLGGQQGIGVACGELALVVYQ
jgi:hypothetical protein